MFWAERLVVFSLVGVSGISFLLSRMVAELSLLFVLIAIFVAIIAVLLFFGVFEVQA